MNFFFVHFCIPCIPTQLANHQNIPLLNSNQSNNYIINICIHHKLLLILCYYWLPTNSTNTSSRQLSSNKYCTFFQTTRQFLYYLRVVTTQPQMSRFHQALGRNLSGLHTRAQKLLMPRTYSVAKQEVQALVCVEWFQAILVLYFFSFLSHTLHTDCMVLLFSTFSHTVSLFTFLSFQYHTHLPLSAFFAPLLLLFYSHTHSNHNPAQQIHYLPPPIVYISFQFTLIHG